MAAAGFLANCRPGFSPAGLPAETASVSKSLIAIAGIGLAGCCVLAWMMNHLVTKHVERNEGSLRQALEGTFTAQLDGPVAVHEEKEGTRRRFVVNARGRVADCRQLATALGSSAWLHLTAPPAPPMTVATEVVVSVRPPSGEPVTITVPAPAAGR
jgi:hypothetical protein